MTELNKKTWCAFKISDIVDNMNIAKSNDFGKLKRGNTTFVGRQSVNNGIQGFVDSRISEAGNCITIGMVGSFVAFWQENAFCTSQNILVLRNKKFNKYNALFICSVLNNYLLKKYSYGKSIKVFTFPEQKIMLPVDKAKKPDYEYMEMYIRNIIKEKRKKYKEYAKQILQEINNKQIKSIEELEWKEQSIVDLFTNIQRGKRLIKVNQIPGNIPYISSSAINNGVDAFIGNNTNVRKFKNCLSLANSGSVGSCFYEPFEFVASDHITHLKNNDYNKYVYLYMATMINRLSEKYNFNREINDVRISKERIILPIEKDYNIDFDYMEQFIKNIIKKKINKYIAYIDSNNI